MADKRLASVYGRRLREAREAYGVSQRDLGIAAGLDEFTASPRINRYENGVNQPKLGMQLRLADALGKPLAFFYAEDDDLARLISDHGRKARPGRAAKNTKQKR